MGAWYPVRWFALLTVLCATAPWPAANAAPAGPFEAASSAAEATADAPALPVSPAHSGVLRLAVAANFRAALQGLAGEFERRHGVTLSPSFGSSGLLAAQIRQGAPFDAFFSADTTRPEALIDDGLAAAPATVYARGRVALRAPPPGQGEPVTARAASRAGSPRIGIANPRHAPYGAAAIQCLDRLGLRERVRHRLVFANNVNQVDHFLESGALDTGFMALGQLVARGIPTERYWICPADYHAPIEQAAVLLLRSSRKPAVRTLLRFMIHPDTQARLERLGYQSGD